MSFSSSIHITPGIMHLCIGILFSVAREANVNALVSLSVSLPKLVGHAQVDYSAASEFIETHYHIPNYFGNETTVRLEPIFDARSGVVTKVGTIVAPLGSMKECGFCLLDAPTKVENFEDLSQIQSTYLAEMKELILLALQIDSSDIESIVFWHPMLRGEAMKPLPRSNSEPAMATAASMVHIDTDVGAYGLEGIVDLVGKNLVDPDLNFDQDQIYKQLSKEKQRFLFLNTWRPLVPVRSRPLALWAVQYKETNGLFPTMRPCLDSSLWYVFPDMEPSECLIFKQFDRRLDQPCDFWHTSLDIKSNADTTYAPRRSFDMKVLVILKEAVAPEQDRLAMSTAPELTLEESANFCAEQARKRQKINL